jgi:hypothetical protein
MKLLAFFVLAILFIEAYSRFAPNGGSVTLHRSNRCYFEIFRIFSRRLSHQWSIRDGRLWWNLQISTKEILPHRFNTWLLLLGRIPQGKCWRSLYFRWRLCQINIKLIPKYIFLPKNSCFNNITQTFNQNIHLNRPSFRIKLTEQSINRFSIQFRTNKEILSAIKVFRTTCKWVHTNETI